MDVLRAEPVLFAILHEALGGVDHKDAGAGVGILFVDDEDAGGNARAVEQVCGQADDALDQAVPDEVAADVCFLVTTEQDAVRQDDRPLALALERLDQNTISVM